MTETPSDAIEPRAARRGRWRIVQVAAGMLVLALLGLLVWSLVHSSEGAQFVKHTAQGTQPEAPQFNLPVIWRHPETWPGNLLPRLRDGRITLQELRGQPVVLNFWASWCVPCKAEAPALRRAANRYRGRVAFVGIDVQDLTSSARRFLRRYEVDYVSLRDGTDDTYTAYGLTGIPETYFIDRRGRATEHVIGRVDDAKLASGIRRLMPEETR